MSTFSSANVTDGNLLLIERTHRIKITYSRNSYALSSQLANSYTWYSRETEITELTKTWFVLKTRSQYCLNLTCVLMRL